MTDHFSQIMWGSLFGLSEFYSDNTILKINIEQIFNV